MTCIKVPCSNFSLFCSSVALAVRVSSLFSNCSKMCFCEIVGVCLGRMLGPSWVISTTKFWCCFVKLSLVWDEPYWGLIRIEVSFMVLLAFVVRLCSSSSSKGSNWAEILYSNCLLVPWFLSLYFRYRIREVSSTEMSVPMSLR